MPLAERVEARLRQFTNSLNGENKRRRERHIEAHQNVIDEVSTQITEHKGYWSDGRWSYVKLGELQQTYAMAYFRIPYAQTAFSILIGTPIDESNTQILPRNGFSVDMWKENAEGKVEQTDEGTFLPIATDSRTLKRQFPSSSSYTPNKLDNLSQNIRMAEPISVGEFNAFVEGPLQ